MLDARALVAALSDASASARDGSLAAVADAVWAEAVARYPEARFNIALSKYVPSSALVLLADDPSARVRSMVAMKRKTPPELLLRLARDRDEGVRLLVARNRATPTPVLAILEDDPWHEVAAVARARLRAEGAAPT